MIVRTALILLILLCWRFSFPAPLQAQSNANLPADLLALVDEALKANREIKQMAELRSASKETIRSAGALEDPEVGFTVKDIPVDTWAFNKEPMTQKMIEASQKLPFPGKRRLRSEAAAEQNRSDDFSYKDKVNEIRAKMVMAYWGLSLTHTAFDITEKNKNLWEQTVEVAEARYRVGQGSQADVIQAQVELGNYLNRLLQWRQRQESFRADINALRSQPPNAPVAQPQPLRPRPFPIKLDYLLAQAEARPQLQALQALVAKQEKMVDLAKKDYYPDARILVGYGFRETLAPPINQKQADMFTGAVMFNVPIWWESRIKPRIREELARTGAAREAHQSAWNQLNSMIKDRYAKLQRLAQQINLFDQAIVPQARQAAEASLASYQVGSLPFAQLYQNQIAVYNTELMLQEYLKDFEETWAELEWLVGEELPRRLEGRK